MITLPSCQGTRPENLGIDSQKQLTKCPSSPNCVVSFYEQNKDHFIDPIKYQSEPQKMKERLKSYLASRKDATLIKEDNLYLYYEFTTPLLKFVDDV